MPIQKAIQLKGLVLDYFLQVMDETAKDFHLSKPHFSLKEIEERQDAKKTLEEIVLRVIKRNGFAIYSQRHPILSGITMNVYAGRVGPSAPARWRIRVKYLRPVLRVLLERALQIIVQLPSRDPKQRDKRQIRILASRLLKLADEADLTLNNYVVNNRIAAYYGGSEEPGKDRVFRIPVEMRWAGETLIKVCARTKVIKPRMDSPNPQIRFTLLVLDWITAFTGSPRYEDVSTLITAAFEAGKREPPKWIERLAIEAHSKRRRRIAWGSRGLEISSHAV